MTRRLGPVAYGSVFVLLVPALLATWAWRLDHAAMAFWPIPVRPWVGSCLALAGFGLMAASMRALWVTGKGLPMNAYPPPVYVADSSYAVLSHPIYVGFVCVVGGIAIAAGSRAGLWVVAPTAALAAIALVTGYEGPRLRQRFGDATMHAPIFGVPAADRSRASWPRRWSATAIALGPWAIVYAALSRMPTPGGAHDLRMAWEHAVPTVPWMIWVYSAAYPLGVAGPLLLRTQAELRRYVIAAWLATLSGFTLILVVPGRAALLPLAGDGAVVWLTHANRALDAEWLALPSFHAVWIVLAACCLRSRCAPLAPLWTFIAVAVSVSCVLTGSHAVIDVVAGIVLGMLSWHYECIWQWLVRRAEALSNSWTAVEVGPVRIISHALWSAAAATAGIGIVLLLAGPGLVGGTALVFGAGLVVAGAWGYLLEGGGRLSRPFGYHGFLFGATTALMLLALVDIAASERLTAAFACGAPLGQAIGRLRCLVQGCCHGKPVAEGSGIRVVHPKSRVTALSQLRGVPIHPTQLYSIIGNLWIFGCLWRLWNAAATATFIAGIYLVLSSLARFVEEQYRGEPQTRRVFDLAVYQWLAIIVFVAGIGLTMINSLPVQAAPVITWASVLTSLAAGALAAIFMSVDFPSSQRRFSRLTVSQSD
jgi:hypothetical protein